VFVHVGVLGGTGPAGSALALRLAAVGYDVTIGSRSKERALETVEELVTTWPDRGLRLFAGDNPTAAQADVVIVATPWDSAGPTAASVAEQLRGKVVISMGNAIVRMDKEFSAILPARGSVAATVQAAVPDARVAAAFHHLPAKEVGDINHPIESDVLICSDHPMATVVTSEIVAKIPGLRAVDAGSLASAGAIESCVAVILGVNIRYRTRVAVRLTGLHE
jgi:NADPH-dependent F420 reductase